ncbi:MAG: serine hydroxymethyltransferase [Clostridia bacterium]|nr:serine hydroxymethyltransferase [Clostridia bacterium]
MDMNLLKMLDPELAECLELEETRQENNLEMIASESVQPELTLALAGSAFNNKTAVGNPGKQRLKGSQYADRLEILAKERACELFGADHAIMTTYSGSVANYCAFAALLDLGDRVLSMDPSAGAHQTHGGKNNITSRMYDFRYFGLNPETLLIDYEEAERITKEFRPKLIVVGSAAYSRRIDYERLADIAHKNGAYFMTDIAHFSGLIAAGASNSPVPFADVVTASTTKTMCGPHSGFIMCKQSLADIIDKSVYPGVVASLHLQTLAAMTYALQNSQTPEFRKLMHDVVENAQYFCEALKKRGFGIVTGGTDCHMFVADLRPFGTDCEKLADVMQEVGITVNTKAIPFDNSPVPRGLRAGTTVLTQRGFGKKELDEVADIWYMLATDMENEDTKVKAKKQVLRLSGQFPLPESKA